MEYKGRALIASSFIFLGLLLPLRFPQYFWYIIASVAAVAAFLAFWIFGERPSITRLREDWFTLVFLLVFTGAASVFGYLLANPIVQALILGSTGIFVYFIYLVASRLKRNYTPSLFLRNIISITAILGIFFASSDLLRWVSVSTVKFPQIALIVLLFGSVFMISEFLFEVQGFEKSVLYSLSLALVLTQIVWISSYWLINYPYSEKVSNIGVPLPAILGAVIFYLFWGISHHRIEGTLSKRVMWEYILISSVFILILFLTARWLPQVR